MGADHVANYKTNPDHKVAREVTNGTGVDLVVEVAGTGRLGARRAHQRHGGADGVLAGRGAAQPGAGVTQNIRLRVTVISRETFEEMVRAMEIHRTEPPVDERLFAFEAAGRPSRSADRPALRQDL